MLPLSCAKLLDFVAFEEGVNGDIMLSEIKDIVLIVLDLLVKELVILQILVTQIEAYLLKQFYVVDHSRY